MFSFMSAPLQPQGGDAKLTSDPTPAKKVTRACAECHKSKIKCIFSNKRHSKCDRCIRINKECVPHLSRQGQKRNTRVEKNANSAAASPVAGSGSSAAALDEGNIREIDSKVIIKNSQPESKYQFRPGKTSSQSGSDMNSRASARSVGGESRKSHDPWVHKNESWFGTGSPANLSAQLEQLMQNTANSHNAAAFQNSMASSVPSYYGADQTQNPHDSLLHDQGGVASFDDTKRMSSPERATTSANAKRQGTNNTSSSTQPNITTTIDTTQPNETVNTNRSSVLLIPLRQWIKGALDSNVMVSCSQGSAISSDYLSSCLTIALSLSKQISDAEALSNETLRSLPLDSWTGCVRVKVKYNGNANAGGQDVLKEPSTWATADDSESTRLEAVLDSIREEDDFDAASFQNIFFRKVDSAEIFVDKILRRPSTNEDRFDFYSSRGKRQRIYSLGLLFCELFSGGRMPMSIRAPSAGAFDAPLHPMRNNDHGLIPTGFERLNLATMTKLNEDNDDGSRGHNYTGTRKKLHKSQATLNSSIESIKLLGVPYPLCDLLYNMLDCINGDLTGDEAYTEMSDVAADLQLMIDKPSLFFHDLDVVTLSSSGLQLKDNLFMRDGEFASLQCAYDRAVSGSSEVAIISGGSGTGKTYLASRLGGHITSIGGIFLSVKFNQLKQANPFSAIVSAFNEYCNILMSMSDSDGVKLMASKLRDALGQDAHHLIMLIPKLSEMLGCNSADTSPSIQDCVNGQKKIHYLLIRFVEVMSACSKVTLTLFLDDLQ
ncbi:hypothetical protein ACHAWX_004912 [Stephanocyclus meneghinianus]